MPTDFGLICIAWAFPCILFMIHIILHEFIFQSLIVSKHIKSPPKEVNFYYYQSQVTFRHLECLCTCANGSSQFQWVLNWEFPTFFFANRFFQMLVFQSSFKSFGTPLLILLSSSVTSLPSVNLSRRVFHTSTCIEFRALRMTGKQAIDCGCFQPVVHFF